jgi:hypothetical protein
VLADMMARHAWASVIECYDDELDSLVARSSPRVDDGQKKGERVKTDA